MKVKERLNNCSRLTETKVTTTNAVHDTGFSFAIKDIIGTISKI